MMGKWKKCFKLLKYSQNFKSIICGATILLLMGLGMVLAGGVLAVVIRRILYKKPFSKWIVREYMKKMG